ncbi:MAG: hypothetical protein KDE26_06840 [Bacteroidetes bacterium]|nr:hypothetical protein [Bacteroidota bacterium]MCB0842961.1 hypothetical protein [Bacteroidota bacterium]
MNWKDSSYFEQTEQLFTQFDIDLNHGFIPAKAPLQTLSSDFFIWEELAGQFSDLLNTGQFRRFARRIPVVKTNPLSSTEELERAMLLLSCFAHGYVWENGEEIKEIPAGIAVPWVKVANRLGRPPIITHASLVLNNWKKIDPQGPGIPENLAPVMQFHGGQDEAWFYMLTVAMEFLGGELARKILLLYLAAEKEDLETVETALKGLSGLIQDLRVLLARMPERCDPYIFYHRVRPFLSSFREVRYHGVKENPVRSYDGGSAAQSSMIQALDAVLKVNHENDHSRNFLEKMRKHMPPAHARFIAFLEEESQIRQIIKRHPSVKEIFYECLDQLAGFRTDHLRVVSQYIMNQSGKVGPGNTGTGGTNPMIFLKQVQKDTLQGKKTL